MGLIGSQERGETINRADGLKTQRTGFSGEFFLSIAAEKGDGNAEILKKKINLSLVVVGLMLKTGDGNTF